jgi:hypothetical protein
MKPTVLDRIPFRLEAGELAQQLRIGPGSDDFEALRSLIAGVSRVARPKAIFTASFITGRGEDFMELDGVGMMSRVMPVNFQAVHRAFPYVATCGVEAEEWSREIADPLEAWWADALKLHLLGDAIKFLGEHLKKALRLGKFSSMNPGSLPDWPITEQAKLFSLLGDVKAQIGVELTASMLMLPTKSVSGIYFETEKGFENCELCARANCPGRRKPYGGSTRN